MLKKDKERWKLQLAKKGGEQAERLRKIIYDMELTINRIQEETIQLKKQLVISNNQNSVKVTEIHEYYTDLLKKTKIGKNPENEKIMQQQNKNITQLRKQVLDLQKRLKQESKKGQELNKLIKINESNTNTYEAAITKLKTQKQRQSKKDKQQYEKRMREANKQLSSITVKFNQMKIQYDEQTKKLKNTYQTQIKSENQTHQKQVYKLRNQKNQYIRLKQPQIKKKIQQQYSLSLNEYKEKHRYDLQQQARVLKQQYQAIWSKTQKQCNEKLARQAKISDDLKGQCQKHSKAFQLNLTENAKKVQQLKLQHTKQLDVLKNQLQKSKGREVQLHRKCENNLKQINKLKYEDSKKQQLIETLKNEHSKKINNSEDTYHKTVEKFNSEQKILTEKYQKQINSYMGRIQQLTQEIISHKKNISEQQKQLISLDQVRISLQNQVQRLRKQFEKSSSTTVNQYEKSIEKMKKDTKIAYDKFQREIKNLNSTISKLNTDIQNLHNNKKNLEKQIGQLNIVIQQKDAEITEYNDKINKTQKDLKFNSDKSSKKQTEIKNHLENIKRLEKTIKEKNDFIMQKQKEIQEHLETIDRYDKELTILNQQFAKQTQNLENQLWDLNEQMGKMTPKTELQQIKSKTQQQKIKLNQNMNVAQGIINELKNKLIENQRYYTDKIKQLNYDHKEQINELILQNENKIMELKMMQAEENQKKQNKYMGTLETTKDQLKQQYRIQLSKIKQQNRKIVEQLTFEKKKEATEFKNQIQSLKSKNNTLLEQMETTQASLSSQKQEVLSKNRNDQMTILSIKTKLEQYDIRQKYLQSTIEQLKINLKELSDSSTNKQKQYEKEVRLLNQALQKQMHDKQLENLKKDQDLYSQISSQKQSYETKIFQLQRKGQNDKKFLQQKINLLESRINQKDKELDKLRKQNQENLYETIKIKQGKQFAQKQRQKQINENIEQMLNIKENQYAYLIKNLEQKNQQYYEEIMTLQGSNKMLRQQLTSYLSRSNKEKQLYQEINRLKAQLCRSQRKSTKYLQSPSGSKYQINQSRVIDRFKKLQIDAGLKSSRSLSRQKYGQSQVQEQIKISRFNDRNKNKHYTEISQSQPILNDQNDDVDTQKKFKLQG